MSMSNNRSLPTDQLSRDEPPERTTKVAWKLLCRVGAVAALLTIVLMLIGVPVFLIWPPPGGLQPTASAVTGCFTLLRANWLLGLLDLDLVMLASTLLLVPVYLALYASLRQTSPSFMATALVLVLVGIAAYLAVNPAFSMLMLSTQYAAATDVTQRASLVAAGQAALASYQRMSFDVYYSLGAVTTLIISAVMLYSPIFSQVTAYLGMVTGILMVVPPTAGETGLSFLSFLPLVLWYFLIARRLFWLAQGASSAGARRHTAQLEEQDLTDHSG